MGLGAGRDRSKLQGRAEALGRAQKKLAALWMFEARGAGREPVGEARDPKTNGNSAELPTKQQDTKDPSPRLALCHLLLRPQEPQNGWGAARQGSGMGPKLFVH